jgi:hypothetical protein
LAISAVAGAHVGGVGEEALRQRIVGFEQGPGRAADHGAGQIAHVVDKPADLPQILVEGGDGMFGHDDVLV